MNLLRPVRSSLCNMRFSDTGVLAPVSEQSKAKTSFLFCCAFEFRKKGSVLHNA